MNDSFLTYPEFLEKRLFLHSVPPAILSLNMIPRTAYRQQLEAKFAFQFAAGLIESLCKPKIILPCGPSVWTADAYWWDTRPLSNIEKAEVDECIRYLESRQLLQRNAEEPNLLRIKRPTGATAVERFLARIASDMPTSQTVNLAWLVRKAGMDAGDEPALAASKPRSSAISLGRQLEKTLAQTMRDGRGRDFRIFRKRSKTGSKYHFEILAELDSQRT